MTPLAARILALAAVNGLVATLLAATFKHLFSGFDSPKADTWFETALLMQYAASICLLGAVTLAHHGKPHWAHRTTWCTFAGILGFCGSLYYLAVQGPGGLGALHWITPIGGLFLMAGWALLALGALRSPFTS